jgi:PASTA domain
MTTVTATATATATARAANASLTYRVHPACCANDPGGQLPPGSLSLYGALHAAGSLLGEHVAEPAKLTSWEITAPQADRSRRAVLMTALAAAVVAAIGGVAGVAAPHRPGKPAPRSAPASPATAAPAGGDVIVVPSLAGMGLAQAEQAAIRIGLRVQKGQQAYPHLPRGMVAAQTPAPGSKVPAGATVVVYDAASS